MNSKSDDFKSLSKFLVVYYTRKTKSVGFHIEKVKNKSVDVLMHRRGRLQKYIWHTSMVGLASVGFLSSGAWGGNSIIASSFPGMTTDDRQLVQTFDPTQNDGTFNSLVDLKTSVSSKPRSEIIIYKVKSGETLSQIAENFGVDVDTIKWANDLDDDTVKPDQELKILPVSGVAVTVKKGDTLDSLAKKYQSNTDTILQFPFNNIAEDLSLKAGDTLIIPDGAPPETPSAPKRVSPQYLAAGPGKSGPSYSAPNGGSFMWPTTFQMISTYFAWWHPGIDMANRNSPPVSAASGGTVVYSGWDSTGYGNRVDIDHGNGYITRYGHLANIFVGNGQKVSKGQQIGIMGTTGRSTGIHLHFEIHYHDVAINPLAILK
jgi:murein DD-endopeptidase MepM/ murein hydrolase activator NlpD